MPVASVVLAAARAPPRSLTPSLLTVIHVVVGVALVPMVRNHDRQA